MEKLRLKRFRFGDGSQYRKKGDRCSCVCHSPKNSLPCCKKCKDDLWPGEICAIENFDESEVYRFDNADDAIKSPHSQKQT